MKIFLKMNVVIFLKHTYIREENFVAGLIKYFNQDIIHSARFQDPAFPWTYFKS